LPGLDQQLTEWLPPPRQQHRDIAPEYRIATTPMRCRTTPRNRVKTPAGQHIGSTEIVVVVVVVVVVSEVGGLSKWPQRCACV
jgi:hypothetical protein